MISPLDTFNLNNTNNSFNRKFHSTDKLSKNSDFNLSNKDLSTYYKSDIQSKTLIKNNSFYFPNSPLFNKRNVIYLYDKCDREIENANKVSKNVFKLDQKITENIEKKLKTQKSIDKFQKIFEDKGKNKNKYQKLEEKNIKEIKRKINEKISDFYAYKNRKEFKGILKESTQAYNIYLDEMNHLNEKMAKRRNVERKKIDRIQFLCDEGFKKKEYLKNKIDIFNKRHKEIKKLNGIIINDDFYIINRNSEKELLGTLLPKLLSSRNKCLNEIIVGNFFNKK